MKLIGLEEHFVTPDLVGHGASTASIAQPGAWAEASRRLLDLTEERLDDMDAAGLDMQVLSLNSPACRRRRTRPPPYARRSRSTTSSPASSPSTPTASPASPPCPSRIPRPRPTSWNAR